MSTRSAFWMLQPARLNFQWMFPKQHFRAHSLYSGFLLQITWPCRPDGKNLSNDDQPLENVAPNAFQNIGVFPVKSAEVTTSHVAWSEDSRKAVGMKCKFERGDLCHLREWVMQTRPLFQNCDQT